GVTRSRRLRSGPEAQMIGAVDATELDPAFLGTRLSMTKLSLLTSPTCVALLVLGAQPSSVGSISAQTTVVVTEATNAAATVSPDGTRLAFASDRAFNGSYDIWVVDLASGALTQWTNTGGVTTSPAPASVDEFEPTWSPDGKAIAFVVGSGAVGTTIQVRDAA